MQLPFFSATKELPKPNLGDPALDRLWDRTNEAYGWHDSGSRSWSFVYYLTFGIATVANTSIAVISGHGTVALGSVLSHNGLIGVLAGISAILTGIGAFGGFERKWHANRVARTRLLCLLTEIETTKPDTSKVCASFKEILSDEDAGIIGSKTGRPDTPAS